MKAEEIQQVMKILRKWITAAKGAQKEEAARDAELILKVIKELTRF